TDRRYQELVREQVIPQQTADTSHATMLQARDAYQQELAMQSYEIVQAPFDGIVTARYVDPGTLIPQSTASSASNSPIVSLAMLAPLRVYAYAPQSLSPFIKDGDLATITVSEFSGRQFSGTITRHPEALDQSTRTMLVEVDLPNADRSLYPGMYADLHLTARVTTHSISAPDDALIFRNDKVYLPIVRGERLNLIPVDLGHDDGYTVEVSGDGLHPGDLVAMNVGEAAHNGEPVQPVEAIQRTM
ncbi:MAG: efflux RND transporter periplasmic adaptor subunit, partial [Deltaproteobacteria bacterium]|nr:efflux RND transporter periplasmic adaptor subunit [Deltaproteobacteria bacterium]